MLGRFGRERILREKDEHHRRLADVLFEFLNRFEVVHIQKAPCVWKDLLDGCLDEGHLVLSVNPCSRRRQR